MTLGLIGTLLSCLTGGWVTWWLWTVEDRILRNDIPWAPKEPLNMDDFPIVPSHDPIGLT